jgi:hypothetical protein
MDIPKTRERIGPGRPKRGESAWRHYVATAKDGRNEAMEILGAEAERRGYSMLGFAGVISCDLRGFQRYFESAKLQPRNAQKIAKALGYPAIVARALNVALTASDTQVELDFFCTELEYVGIECFGANSDKVRAAILGAASHREWLGRFCKVSILARHGLWRGDIDRVLGPYFSAIEQGSGLALRPFVEDYAQAIERRRMAESRLRRSLRQLGLPQTARSSILRMVEPYIKGITHFVEELDTPEGKRRHRAAQTRRSNRLTGKLEEEYIRNGG